MPFDRQVLLLPLLLEKYREPPPHPRQSILPRRQSLKWSFSPISLQNGILTWASTPRMIESSILCCIHTLRTSIEDLSSRVIVCENRHKEDSDVMTLKVKVADLRKDVHHWKCTEFTLLYGATNDLDTLETSKFSLLTIGKGHNGVVAVSRSNSVTDKENIKVQEASIYREMTMTGKIIIDVAVQTSMVEAPFNVPVSTSDRAGPFEEILGIEAQAQAVPPRPRHMEKQHIEDISITSLFVFFWFSFEYFNITLIWMQILFYGGVSLIFYVLIHKLCFCVYIRVYMS